MKNDMTNGTAASARVPPELMRERSAHLALVAAELKTELFGIDEIIDRVIESIRAWYVLPHIIRRPVISEKSYALLDQNVYTFEVSPDANKVEIRQAVEAIFGVRVVNVNTLNRQGKRKRNRRDGKVGKRPDRKRAIVSLAEGDRIEIFQS